MKIIALLVAGAAAITAMPASAAVVEYMGNGAIIRDYTDTYSTLTVADNFKISDVNVVFNDIYHNFPRDVQLTLEHGSTAVKLLFNNGPGHEGGFGSPFTFDDEAATSITTWGGGAGTFRPVDALSVFDGVFSAGDWTIHAYDSAGGDIGSYGSWTLQLGGAPDAMPAVPEPGSWAMLVAGFGLIGAAARRRSTTRMLQAI